MNFAHEVKQRMDNMMEMGFALYVELGPEAAVDMILRSC